MPEKSYVMGSKGRALFPLPPFLQLSPWHERITQKKVTKLLPGIRWHGTLPAALASDTTPPLHPIAPLPTTNRRKREMPMATRFMPQFKNTCLIFLAKKSQFYIINCCVGVMLSFCYLDVSSLWTCTNTGFGQEGLHDVSVS